MFRIRSSSTAMRHRWQSRDRRRSSPKAPSFNSTAAIPSIQIQTSRRAVRQRQSIRKSCAGSGSSTRSLQAARRFYRPTRSPTRRSPLTWPVCTFVQLVVNDCIVNGESAIVQIRTYNGSPIANAGADQIDVAQGSTIALSGAGSSDPDNDTLTYQWSFVGRPAGSSAAIINPTSIAPSFIVDSLGRYTVQLLVSDGFATSTDTVEIKTPNRAPTAMLDPTK